MSMRWRATAKEWQPNQPKYLDRRGAKIIDQEEGRRRLTAHELNAQIGVRGCWQIINALLPDMEKQARLCGLWGRLKSCVSQLNNMQMKMLDKTSIEQILSIKNNTQCMHLSMTPELLPGQPELTIQTVSDHNRLLSATLAYCEMHCDGSHECQQGCKLKRLLDQSCYIEDCDCVSMIPGMCKYYMVDADWKSIRED